MAVNNIACLSDKLNDKKRIIFSLCLNIKVLNNNKVIFMLMELKQITSLLLILPSTFY